jgi:hypothetical protein
MEMFKTTYVASVASVFASVLGAAAGWAQQPPPQAPDMTFFVTSAGLGNGADLSGLEGADRQCQKLAQAAGAGAKTWRAYLSTQAADGVPAINARDRSVRAPGRNSKAKLWPEASTISMVTATN